MNKTYIITYEIEKKYGRELQERRFVNILEMWAFVGELKEVPAVTGIWMETRQRLM